MGWSVVGGIHRPGRGGVIHPAARATACRARARAAARHRVLTGRGPRAVGRASVSVFWDRSCPTDFFHLTPLGLVSILPEKGIK